MYIMQILVDFLVLINILNLFNNNIFIIVNIYFREIKLKNLKISNNNQPFNRNYVEERNFRSIFATYNQSYICAVEKK